MTSLKHRHAALALLGILIGLASSAAPVQAAASKAATQSAKAVAKVCPAKWTEQECLAAVSESNLVMASNYAEKLDKNGKTAAVEQIKEHCAASTAAAKGEYPANAMRSAYTECANIIVDVSTATGVQPDASHYQLLVGAVLCLDKDPRCPFIEQGLKAYE